MTTFFLAWLSLATLGAGFVVGYFLGKRESHHAGISIGVSEATAAVRRDLARSEGDLKAALLKLVEVRIGQLRQSIDYDAACLPSQLDPKKP